MIISIRIKNFYSFRNETLLDFTADRSALRRKNQLPENLIDFDGDKFVNVIGLFGGNAAGKSNFIKAVAFCRNLVLNSHLSNEGSRWDFMPFKFGDDDRSEFAINFVTEGIEYEYSFTLGDNRVLSESLFHYPNKRRARIFSRDENGKYNYRKGLVTRPAEVEANTGAQTLFLSRASSMNRPIAQTIYRFFLNEIVIGCGEFNMSAISRSEFEAGKNLLLKALQISDSDITDIRIVEYVPGQFKLQSFHREDPDIPFDFEKEESEGTKRLFFILLMLLKKSLEGAAIFFDEFDLKLHLRLAEFLLDVVRASRKAQMVFTSHNFLLIDMAKLRPEQIVFINKQADGNSEAIPLSDYEGLGKNTDIRKAYLQGRFDAVPYVGDIYRLINEIPERI